MPLPSHVINQSHLNSFRRGVVVVAVEERLDLSERAPRALGQDERKSQPTLLRLRRRNRKLLCILRGAARRACGLVDHHAAVGEGASASGRAGGEEDRRDRIAVPEARGRNRRFQRLHHVVAGEAGIDFAAAARDLQVDGLARRLVLEVEELSDDGLG